MTYNLSRHARDDTSLYSRKGVRKYLNAEERQRLLAALPEIEESRALFIEMLFWTGARISEVLALRYRDFQITEHVVVLRSLKRRAVCFREVLLPPALVARLDIHFILQGKAASDERLWPFSRVTGWRSVREAMALANITLETASPKSIRHSFALTSLRVGVPLNLVQRWMGHARISSTAIYCAAIGPEERGFAERMW